MKSPDPSLSHNVPILREETPRTVFFYAVRSCLGYSIRSCILADIGQLGRSKSKTEGEIVLLSSRFYIDFGFLQKKRPTSYPRSDKDIEILMSKHVGFLNRRFLADSLGTALFWTLVYAPIFLYTSKSVEAAVIGLASAALLEGLLGGPYGKFLDWFRKKLSC